MPERPMDIIAYLTGGIEIFFSPIHCIYFCVRHTDGAARIYFFLPLSLPKHVTLWSRIIPVHVREREVRRKKKKKKKPRKKHRDQDLNPQTLSPELSLLSVRPRCPAQATAFFVFTLLSFEIATILFVVVAIEATVLP